MPPRVILIGPPGAGKTSIGKELALLWGCSFADTDAIIEKLENTSISSLFVEFGEEYFRSKEIEVLQESLAHLDGVVSLGGGAPLSEQAQKMITNSGCIVVFLDVSLSAAAPRIGFNRDRPLLLGNPRAQWQDLMSKRKPIYESLATYILNTDNLNPQQAAHELVTLIK